MSRKQRTKYIFLFVFFVAAILFCSYKFGKWKYKDAYSMEDLYSQITEDNMDFKKHAYYVMDFDPSGLDYFIIADNAVTADPYTGCNLFGFEYTYDIKDGKYYLDIEYKYYLNKLQYFLADMRISLICNRIEGLSDYEKVKAVHDYIVRYCEYSYAGSGAYNTLYQGLSACNGYALSFFRIMEKSGIPVTFEVGGNHAWNKVYLDGYWYNIDLTWDDAGGKEVSYQYFLKNDADWEGHEHGGSDAPVSYEITGKSAEEYYKMFPYYQLYYYLLIFVVIVSVILCVSVISYMRSKRKRAKRLARQNVEYEEYLNSRSSKSGFDDY